MRYIFGHFLPPKAALTRERHENSLLRNASSMTLKATLMGERHVRIEISDFVNGI